ncbi:MAG TPA: MFS transporter [Fimbriiglobus sp.]|nr:MFS transporter [Fimbriiglobus sp.]
MSRYLMLALLCLAAVVAYVQRTAIAVPAKTIEAELGFGPDDMGLVMAVWFWVYAAFQVPSGWVADRLGSKPALIVFAVAWSLLTGVVGLATGFVGLLVLWGLMGAAQAGIFPCSTKAIGATFPPTGQAFASGMLACSMALGGALSPKLTGLLVAPDGPLSWQQVFALYAVPGIAWAVLFALAAPRPDGPVPAATARRPILWSKLVTDYQMRLLCGQQFLRASAIAFFYTWFPRFLQESKGLSQGESGDLASWPPLAGIGGGLVGGVLSDWLLRRTGNPRLSRQGMACAAMVVCAAVALAAYFTADARAVALLLSVSAFFGLMGGTSGYAVAIRFGGDRVATVFATMNMCGNIGAGLFPYTVGRLVAATGNWDLALLVFAGLFAADAVLWALLNPKRPLFEGDD